MPQGKDPGGQPAAASVQNRFTEEAFWPEAFFLYDDKKNDPESGPCFARRAARIPMDSRRPFSREPSANDFLTARGEPRGRRIAYQEEAGGDISALRQFTQYIRRKERMLPGGAQSRSRFRVSFFMDMDSRGRDRPARSCRAPAMFCKA